jgi:hypothetical protein
MEKFLRDFWKKAYDWIDITKVDEVYDASTGEQRLYMDGSAKMKWVPIPGSSDKQFEVNGSRLGWKADFDREAGSKLDAPFAVAFPFFTKSIETIQLPKDGPEFEITGTNVDKIVGGYAFKRTSKIEKNVFTMEDGTKALTSEFPAFEADVAKENLEDIFNVIVYLRTESTDTNSSSIFGHGIKYIYRIETALGVPLTPRPVLDSDALIQICRNNTFENALHMALGYCNAALEKEPQDGEALESRGLVYILLGKLDNAIADYDTVLKQRPNSAVAHYGRGIARLRKHDVQKAQADLREARETNPQIETEFAGMERAPAWYGLTAHEWEQAKQ